MDEFIGIIKLFAGNFAPRGWTFCNGAILPISGNEALFSILGTLYGGNGTSNFALPNLSSRVPIGIGQGQGLSAYTVGQIAGSENVTLTTPQLPAHTHALGTNTTTATTNVPTGVPAAASYTDDNGVTHPVNTYGPAANAQAAPTGIAGNNQPFSVLQPYIAMNYIICLQGIYPSRN